MDLELTTLLREYRSDPNSNTIAHRIAALMSRTTSVEESKIKADDSFEDRLKKVAQQHKAAYEIKSQNIKKMIKQKAEEFDEIFDVISTSLDSYNFFTVEKTTVPFIKQSQIKISEETSYSNSNKRNVMDISVDYCNSRHHEGIKGDLLLRVRVEKSHYDLKKIYGNDDPSIIANEKNYDFGHFEDLMNFIAEEMSLYLVINEKKKADREVSS